MDEESEGGETAAAATRTRSATLQLFLTVIGFGIPVALYFWLISADGVDMLHADQWFDVKLIHDWSAGTLRFSELWAQHGENRVFFQNLLTLVLARWFHYNTVVEEYLGASFLVAALALVVLAHHRRSPSTPWLWYCPVAFLLLTVGQWAGTLFGFALGWYLIIVCLAVMLWFLDRTVLSWFAWGAAAAAAVVASFSSLQGLFVWVAGLTILLQRRRRGRMAIAWVGAALLTTGLYFYGWDKAQGNSVSYAFEHPGQALQYFFFAIGDIVSVPLPDSPHGAQYGVLAFGVAVFAVALWSLVSSGLRADETSARPIGVALIWVGLLFAAGAAAARAVEGVSNASFTLYVSFDVLILLGSFLVAIDRRPVDRGAVWRHSRFTTGIRVTIVALVLLQVVVGTVNGLKYGRAYRGYELTAAVVTAKIRDVPDGLVASQLGAGYESASFIRQMTAYAKSEHLSLFSTDQVQWYERQQLPKDTTPPVVLVATPRSDEVIHGVTVLDAFASDAFGVTAVRFFGRQGRGARFLIASAKRTTFGWLATWDTARQPDGMYSVVAVASSYGGLRGTSPSVPVQLHN